MMRQAGLSIQKCKTPHFPVYCVADVTDMTNILIPIMVMALIEGDIKKTGRNVYFRSSISDGLRGTKGLGSERSL